MSSAQVKDLQIRLLQKQMEKAKIEIEIQYLEQQMAVLTGSNEPVPKPALITPGDIMGKSSNEASEKAPPSVKTESAKQERVFVSSVPEANRVFVPSGEGSSGVKVSENPSQEAEVKLQPGIFTKGNKPNFYVVYDGEKSGVYDDWAIVKAIVDHTPYRFKGFKTLEEATQSLTAVRAVDTGFKPVNSYREAIKQSKKGFTTLGRFAPAKKGSRNIYDEVANFSVTDFVEVFQMARASGNEYERQKYFTNDIGKISLFVFCAGADPDLVSRAFRASLVRTIYPSKDLGEIKYLPQNIIQEAKRFAENSVGKNQLVLKIVSSLPDWDEEGVVKEAYHVISLAVCKQFPTEPEPIRFEPPSQEDCFRNLHIWRAHRLSKVLTECRTVTQESREFITGSAKIVIKRRSRKELNGVRHILAVESKFADNSLDVGQATKRDLCPLVKGIMGDQHQCDFCAKMPDTPTSNNEGTMDDPDLADIAEGADPFEEG